MNDRADDNQPLMNNPHLFSQGVETLRRTFPGLTTNDHAALLQTCKFIELPADTVVCEEGRIESTFYLIISGRVEVSQRIDQKERRLLQILEQHGFFGEMALIQSVPRTATVRTLERTTLLEIDRPAFDLVLHRSPEMAGTMLREVIMRLQANDQKVLAEFRSKNEKLAAAYDELRRQDQLRSEFLTTVSHELRTPLTSAKGFLQLMRSGIMDDAALKAALATVGDNVEVIIALVNDILFLQEIEGIAPQFESTDVAEVVRRVIEEKREQAAGAGIELNANFAPDLPRVQGDAKSLARMFGGLIDNAIKFSPNGGEVRVEATRDADAITVSVSDHGVGIAPEHMPKIFDRFFHVDEINGARFGGVGLGLAIAKNVAERHGGKIEAESEGVAGKGSVFRVRLPSGG